jgi:dethiobiotin synthetase
MKKIIVAGIGTDVGKTVVAAILTARLNGDYWKPVESGAENTSDIAVMGQLLDPSKHTLFNPVYSLQAPLSIHHAARLENILIEPDRIIPPKTSRPLIIEGIGGVMAPLTTTLTALDLFKHWQAEWIIVSKHYLGSINHTLLTIDALKKQSINIAGIIFNGAPNPDSEAAILEISKIPHLASLLPEREITSKTIQRYAQQWKL